MQNSEFKKALLDLRSFLEKDGVAAQESTFLNCSSTPASAGDSGVSVGMKRQASYDQGQSPDKTIKPSRMVSQSFNEAYIFPDVELDQLLETPFGLNREDVLQCELSHDSVEYRTQNPSLSYPGLVSFDNIGSRLISEKSSDPLFSVGAAPSEQLPYFGQEISFEELNSSWGYLASNPDWQAGKCVRSKSSESLDKLSGFGDGFLPRSQVSSPTSVDLKSASSPHRSPRSKAAREIQARMLKRALFKTDQQ